MKFVIGKKYHIWNGYAKNIDDIWWNNCVFVGIEKEFDDLDLYKFVDEKGECFLLDEPAPQVYNRISVYPQGIKDKKFMFLEAK